jgi:hypothetical protein
MPLSRGVRTSPIVGATVSPYGFCSTGYPVEHRHPGRLVGTQVRLSPALRSFDGAIDIVLKDAPRGLTLSGGRVPRGQEKVYLKISAAKAGEPMD